MITHYSQTLHCGGHCCDLYEVAVSAGSTVNGSKLPDFTCHYPTHYGHKPGLVWTGTGEWRLGALNRK